MAVVFVLLRESGVWEAARNNHKPNVKLKENQSGTNGTQHRAVSSVTDEGFA